ncbi:VOC family protein [Peribacillus sp. SI8-4]|uniref:VOC family protein n=1 Tax=Peribacillus sp. SI8-4 TaxID=3048009 RepID=UPI0025543DF1|nr:VOC family protein [Peribacillus sp. SI8-4]
MSNLQILDFSFKNEDNRSKDLNFLQTVLNFKVQFENEVYTALSDDNGLTIGFMNTDKLEEAAREGYREQVIPNFSVKKADFEQVIDSAEHNGGKVLMPLTHIEGTGLFAIVQSPAGINLALVQEQEK